MKALGKIGLIGVGSIAGFVAVTMLIGLMIEARTDYVQEREMCLRGAMNGLEIVRCEQ